MNLRNETGTDHSDVKTKILYVEPIEACKLMNSDMKGLSRKEAEKRLREYGKNRSW